MKTLYFISMSGGKDSTATAIYMLNNYKKEKLRFIFADTGWEHPKTYEYIKYLEEKLQIKIMIVKSDKYDGMEDLCIKKKMFPNRQRKFCTDELKIIPIIKLYNQYKEYGFKIISVVGVRREESRNRAGENIWKTSFTKTARFSEWTKLKNISKSKAVKNFYDKNNSITVYQPIVYWTTQKVFDYHKANNIEVNPLYKIGATRVGCFPCINANIEEKKMLDKNAVKKIRHLENEVSKVTKNAKNATFFYVNNKPASIDTIKEKYPFVEINGCVNNFGVCE